MSNDTSRRSRDDFRQQTINRLARRVAYRCSNPECRRSTIGPEQGGEGTVLVGIAAHITAAAARGPRFDPTLTPEQRRHQGNGIWLCEIHGKQVDVDEKHFTVELLRKWKQEAEKEAAEAINRAEAPASPRLETAPDEEDIAFARGLGFGAEQSPESITVDLLQAAVADLEAFRGKRDWSRHLVEPDMTLGSSDHPRPFGIDRLAWIANAFGEVVLVADPGTGKTTTMVQLAHQLSVERGIAAIYIPMSEWAADGGTFFQSLTNRRAFRNFEPRHFMVAAEYGPMALILDGWNELGDDSRLRAAHQIDALRRDYPEARIVISTRQRAIDVPMTGLVVHLEGLTFQKQEALARELRGAEGEALLDAAWRVSGLRELVPIPLYLKALANGAHKGELPATKEEVLRLFVREHEAASVRAETLRTRLFGMQDRYLAILAAEVTRRQATTLNEGQARGIIKHTGDGLVTDGQLATPLQPTAVLDTLVDCHILVRSGTGSGSVAFQHQQFQEWYASFEVEATLRASGAGNQDAAVRLRVGMLNEPAWEEAILFACERASRGDDEGIAAVAAATLDTMEIDPLFAAEMIFRSSTKVWERIGSSVASFIGKWHMQGQVDRAASFMISSGRAEFATEIWALISNPDDQIHLAALRAGRQFRPSVLGPNAREKLAALPDAIRSHEIAEIASNGGIDCIELAADLACSDTSETVKFAVIEALQFRRADRFVSQVLRGAPDGVWRNLAVRGYADEIADCEASGRLKAEEQRIAEEEIDPIQKLAMLGAGRVAPGNIGRELVAKIAAPEFPVKDQRAPTAIRAALEYFPDEACAALVARLEAGLEVPYGTGDLLAPKSLSIDRGPLTRLVFAVDDRNRTADAAARVVGPETVGALIDRVVEIEGLLRANEGSTHQFSNEYSALRQRIASTGQEAFCKAVITRRSTCASEVIGALAEFLAFHGQDAPSRPPYPAERHAELVDLIQQWADVLLKSEQATRTQMAHLARAITRLPDPALFKPLSMLLAEDLARRRIAREAFLKELQRGRRSSDDSHMSWENWYRDALSAVGGRDVEELMIGYLPDSGYCGFGESAAWVLKDLAEHRPAPSEGEPRVMRSEFAGVEARRAKLLAGDRPTHPSADAIFAVIGVCVGSEQEREAHQHALTLARPALLMPHGKQDALIASLLSLPVPWSQKQPVLKALVLAGEVVDADMIVAGICELIEAAKSKPWLLDENSGRLEGWLTLLPFSSRPVAMTEILGMLSPEKVIPWRLRSVLSALGFAPAADAVAVLQELVRLDPRFLAEHGWLSALERIHSVAAARVLMLVLVKGAPEAIQSANARTSARMLADAAIRHPEIRQELYAQYAALHNGIAKSILESAIAEAADAAGILMLVRSNGAENRRLPQTSIYSALQNLLTARRASPSFSGAQEVVSVPAPGLRRELFALAVQSGPAASLAFESLTAFDDIREQFGAVTSEPRHPDISANRPWPTIEHWRRAQA